MWLGRRHAEVKDALVDKFRVPGLVDRSARMKKSALELRRSVKIDRNTFLRCDYATEDVVLDVLGKIEKYAWFR
jgi:hypothetical protein